MDRVEKKRQRRQATALNIAPMKSNVFSSPVNIVLTNFEASYYLEFVV